MVTHPAGYVGRLGSILAPALSVRNIAGSLGRAL